jgi:SAM-dependent methyltransferase
MTPTTDIAGGAGTAPGVDAPRIFTPEYYERMRRLEAGSWWNAAMRDAARRLLAIAPLPERGLALDVGCGSGQTMTWLRTLLPGWRTIGIDVAADGLRAAHVLGERVATASALQLPFADGSASLVVTLDVVQHLPLGGGDATAFREMRRVLAPGGWLLLRTNAQAFPRTADDAAAAFHKYEPRELRAKLEAAGFEVARLSRINALLGLAEIPRELRARSASGSDGYHGLLATAPARGGPVSRVKRAWLQLEGRAVAAGIPLPLGRTLVALCRVPPSADARS